jgi:D-alanine-D-alanine ligase
MAETRSPGRRVAVLMGGQSAERDVSLASGETVTRRLVGEAHRVKPVAIHADGLWEVPLGWIGEGIPETPRDWFSGAGRPPEEALARLRAEGTEVVFVSLHGPFGEDGTVQGFLEVVGMPYTGPETTAAALAMDKRLTKEVLRAAGLPTPPSFTIGPESRRPEGGIDWRAVLERGRGGFPLPWVLKPNRLGSSMGVSIVRDAEQFLVAGREAERYLPWAAPDGRPERGGELLIEEFVPGRELTCGVVALEGEARALPPIEIRPRARPFFDYKAKYTVGASEEICPAPLSPEDTRRVTDLALSIHRLVRADPLSRSDFILDPEGQLQVLEINTIPGMTGTSLIPLSAAKAGLDLGALLSGMVEHALRRAGRAG